METELYWAKLAAVGQVAGASATFLAVVVSLYIARSGRKPRLKLKVGERLILGGAQDLAVLMFSVANMGERPVHVRGIGWRTGLLRWGPRWLTRQAAVQLTGIAGLSTSPPYELQAGAETSSYAEMSNILEYARERDRPFFSRDYPLIGRKRTTVWAYVYTADGYTVYSKPERSLMEALVKAEREALEQVAGATAAI